MLVLLNVFDERVPLFDCTVEQFLIGLVALFLVCAFGFWFWSHLKGV